MLGDGSCCAVVLGLPGQTYAGVACEHGEDVDQLPLDAFPHLTPVVRSVEVDAQEVALGELDCFQRPVWLLGIADLIVEALTDVETGRSANEQTVLGVAELDVAAVLAYMYPVGVGVALQNDRIFAGRRHLIVNETFSGLGVHRYSSRSRTDFRKVENLMVHALP